MMDITSLARFSGGCAYTRTKNGETDKTTSFAGECGKAAAANDGEVSGAEETAVKALEKSPNAIHFRFKYSADFIELHDGYCIAHFPYGDGGPWDPSEMTEDELRMLQMDTRGLPVICIPPNVTNRMRNDDAYADRIHSQIARYVKSHGGEFKDAKLPLDEDGNIIGQDSPDNLFVKMPVADDDGKGFWEARAERQKEYIKYCQQKEMEHRIAISKEFAALRKGGGEFSAEDLLSGIAASGGTSGAAGMLLGR